MVDDETTIGGPDLPDDDETTLGGPDPTPPAAPAKQPKPKRKNHNTKTLDGFRHNDWKLKKTPEALRVVMNEKELKLADGILRGGERTAAFKAAGYSSRNAPEKVQAYVTMVRERAEKDHVAAVEADVLTARERREFLARAVRTPVAQLTEDSDLVQEKTTRFTKGGEEIVTVRGVSKLDALELDAKLAGDLSNGGVTVAPPSFNFAMFLGKLPDTSGLPSVLPSATIPTTLPIVTKPALAEETLG